MKICDTSNCEMKLLSAKECASLLGVTQQTISRLARKGEISSHQVGSRRLFLESDVTSYMKRENIIAAPLDHPRRSKKVPKVTALSFFSGALGLDFGFELAGIQSLLYCENDLKCRMTIEKNRPDAALVGDICELSSDEVFSLSKISRERGVDIMFGGPPCQAFSTAGSRRAFDDARGNVFLKYLDLAFEIQPKYLVIENVRGLLSTPYPLNEDEDPVRHGALRIILARLEEMGYSVSFNLYNAANFGAPQIRERVIMIAKHDGTLMPWLTPTHSNITEWNLPRWRTLKDAIGDLNCVEMHHTQFPEKRLKYFRKLSEGQCWRDLPEEDQQEAMGKSYGLSGGKTGFYRRLSWSKPAPTLVTSPTMPATDLCHPEEDRPLSIEEYSAIQGFPSDWSFCGNIQDIYKQIGNAVPVALGKAIGDAILQDMRHEVPEGRFIAFPYSRYKYTNHNNWNMR